MDRMKRSTSRSPGYLLSDQPETNIPHDTQIPIESGKAATSSRLERVA